MKQENSSGFCILLATICIFMAIDNSGCNAHFVAPKTLDVQEDIFSDKITVRGIAEDLKIGACVVAHEIPYYVQDLDRWPLDVDRQIVEISGKLRYENVIGVSKTPTSGGVPGGYMVIYDYEWRVIR